MEKIVTINLRKKFLKKSRTKRRKVCINFIRKIAERIAKGEVKLHESVNRKLFGCKKLPSKIRIKVKKEGEVFWVYAVD